MNAKGARATRATIVGIAVVAITGAVAADGASTIGFVEVGAARGISGYTPAVGYGTGLAAADYDDDGDVDLFVCNAYGVPDRLFRNLGGTFEEIAGDVGLASTENSRCSLWFDADGDGDLDLVVARDNFQNAAPPPPTVLALFLQGADGSFTDVTAGAGLGPVEQPLFPTHIGGLAAGDLDRDGDLDLVLTQWKGHDHVFINDGGGVFSDMRVEAGISPEVDNTWQPLVHDFTGDGWPDLFFCVDFGPNRLWVSGRDGTFADRAPDADLDTAFNEMGAALGDYDNDGDLDLYTTNISYPGQPQEDHSILYRNDSSLAAPAYVDVAESLGVADVWWGWGVTFLDANRDRFLDLAITNGFTGLVWGEDPSMFFMNSGTVPVALTDVSDAVGFNDTEWGSSLVALDYDRDGDLDLVQTCATASGGVRLLECQDTGVNGDFIVIAPRMLAGGNRRAIGARVTVVADGQPMVRPILAGTSFLGQEPAEAFFGVGSAVAADVTIAWPDGRASTFPGLATGQRHVLFDDTAAPACPADFDGTGDVGIGDLLQVLSTWGPCTGCSMDSDGDGFVGFTDLVAILSSWGPCP